MAAAILRQRRRRNPISDIYVNQMPYTRKCTMEFLNGITETKCVQIFRLSRNGIFRIHEILEPSLTRPSKRNRSLESIHQVCAALKFFGSGCFLNEAGEGLGLEKSSVSRIVRDVSDYFSFNAGSYISMPTTAQQCSKIKEDFYKTAPLANVIGAIDGTHVYIKSPSQPFDESAFVNRKGGHSINCMIVCDNQMKINAIKCDNPGGEHDSCAFNYSILSNRLDGGDLRGMGILLGDSGYPLRPYLFTPLANPVSQNEKQFNRYHKRLRCVVERAIGLLKSRFRCLDRSAGYLNFKPGRASKIILTCVILHNMCILLREPTLEMNDSTEDDNDDVAVGDDRYDGLTARQRVIDNLA